jgi:hypothetical protein
VSNVFRLNVLLQTKGDTKEGGAIVMSALVLIILAMRIAVRAYGMASKVNVSLADNRRSDFYGHDFSSRQKRVLYPGLDGYWTVGVNSVVIWLTQVSVGKSNSMNFQCFSEFRG